MKWTLIAAISVLVLAIAIGLLLPRAAHVERSIWIDAPPCVVFARLNGFTTFNEWSPFVDAVPNARYELAGPTFGVGAKILWSGGDSGSNSGSQEIVAVTPYERIDIALNLGDEGDARSSYLLRRENAGTRLTWTFDTDFGLNIVGRYYGIFLDRLVGPMYATGLESLKVIVEKLPRADWSGVEIELVDVPSTTIAYASGTSGNDPQEIASALAAAYGQVAVFIAANRLEIAGPPLAITNYWDERGYGFDAGMPVAGAPSRGVAPGAPVRMGETYGGRAVRVHHVGPYSGLRTAHETAVAFIVAHGLETNGRAWESFVSDPLSTPEDQIVTEVFVPVRSPTLHERNAG